MRDNLDDEKRTFKKEENKRKKESLVTQMITKENK